MSRVQCGQFRECFEFHFIFTLWILFVRSYEKKLHNSRKKFIHLSNTNVGFSLFFFAFVLIYFDSLFATNPFNTYLTSLNADLE